MTDNETPDIPTPTYTMGYSDEFQKMLERRNARISAAHLLPYLEPGLRVLDLGCGPGTISVGLAEAVKPSELHGIDMEESQVEMARAAAAAGGHSNAFFRTGEVTELPFADESFDVVHSHALLMHVPNIGTVLNEAKRVLRPGGLISGRDLIGSSCFAEPELGGLGDVWTTFLNLLEANGAHPQMGKELKRRFLEAGFSGIQASASFEYYSTVEDVAFFHAFAGGWFFSADTRETAAKHGLATPEQFEAWLRMMDEWKDTPGAFAAVAWGEAIGRKT
ncbi:MAG: methyltransferase domain-containing protein [Bryobacterales bacterium]|nr:methyltransferase domain-containing protein [Bryobacterales bacterium]MDE0292631.1 methyltransferase domain-containing protein [Bryobacterales bacterium]MDE0434725.1 methyltransferase domain-containing protein [Bryobacterales bacterium]